ncbi:MAG: tRNA pseudouridine(55) synthase TruB [Woeseia sp.]|nr:tRNA pseudouridine(55) synthase TruB [Woeseia sp.]
MPRGLKRYGEDVNGLLLLNKPSGVTSNKALQIVRKLLNAKKAGHTGSLDPAATGMLPLCFGQATKVCKYLLNSDKSYLVTATLGIATDTGDREGKEISNSPIPNKSSKEWEKIIQSFVGRSNQIPPMHSALKINGKRLYEIARHGEKIDRKPRPIEISSINLLESSLSQLIFRVRCSKGTYIRTLVEDIAKKAGTVAYTSKLHRESVGDFKSENMIEMSVIESLVEQDINNIREKLLPVDIALLGMPKLTINPNNVAKFCAGQKIKDFSDRKNGLTRVYKSDQKFIGIGEVTPNGALSPRRIFITHEKTS